MPSKLKTSIFFKTKNKKKKMNGREESGRQPSGIIGCPTLVLVAESGKRPCGILLELMECGMRPCGIPWELMECGKRPCGIPWVQGGMRQAAMQHTLGTGWNEASGQVGYP